MNQVVPPKPKQKAQVWILSRGDDADWRVLLLKTTPERDGFWQPVTGSIELGETLQKGALREAIEETGLSPLRGIEPIGFDIKFESARGPVHETAFYYETYPGCPKATLDPREHQGYQWVTLSHALTLLKYEMNREALSHLTRILNLSRSHRRETTGF